MSFNEMLLLSIRFRHTSFTIVYTTGEGNVSLGRTKDVDSGRLRVIL